LLDLVTMLLYGIILLSSLFVIMEILLDALQQGIAPAIIVLIYLLVIRYLEHKKEVKKQELEAEEKKKTIRINSDLLDCFNNLNTYLKQITAGIIDKEDDKCDAAIRSSFKAMGQVLAKFAVFTIISNNVKLNKENIIDNINTTVYSEFASVYNELILYSYNNTKLIDAIKDSWKEELISDLKNIIFDDDLDKENKIYTVHNKLNLRINNYISFVRKAKSIK